MNIPEEPRIRLYIQLSVFIGCEASSTCNAKFLFFFLTEKVGKMVQIYNLMEQDI